MLDQSWPALPYTLHAADRSIAIEPCMQSLKEFLHALVVAICDIQMVQLAGIRHMNPLKLALAGTCVCRPAWQDCSESEMARGSPQRDHKHP